MKKKLGILLLALGLVLGFGMTSFAGEWKQDDKGWWYQEDDGYTSLQKVIVKGEDGHDESLQYTVDFSKMPRNGELTPYDRFNLVKAKAYFDGCHFEPAQYWYNKIIDDNTVTYIFEFGSFF